MPTPMIFTVRIPSSGTYTLPLTYRSATSVTINWGDGNTETIDVSTVKPTHIYAYGLFTITITSSGPDGTFGTSGTSLSSNLTSIDQWGGIGITNFSYACNNATGLTSIPYSILPISTFTSVTNMQGMFIGCSNLVSNGISFETSSSLKNVSYMFYGCT